MGLLGTASIFDADVEKATSENNTTEEWGLIIEICDRAGASSINSKDCLRSILKRLGHQDPHIVVQAITLLDACVNNCGKTFHLEIASRDFETEFRKLLAKSKPPVSTKLKALLKKWAENEFKSDSQLNLIPSLVNKLKSEGVDFTDVGDKATKKKEIKTDQSKSLSKEEEDLAKAIELSLQETKHAAPRNNATLYPSMNQMSAPLTPPSYPAAPPQELKKVRALYDFEAAEDNELTFKAGEIIHVIDSSDPNWWKGCNQRGEGLFPTNFVTPDLNAPEQSSGAGTTRSKVEFVEPLIQEEDIVVIDETKIDRLLMLLNEANPEDDGSNDHPEMLQLENEVYRMGPLIDQSLEKADRQHAQLTQLSTDLVEALNLYHSLMREPVMMKPFPPMTSMGQPGPMPHLPPHSIGYSMPPMGHQGLPPPRPNINFIPPQQQVYSNPGPYNNMGPIPQYYANAPQPPVQGMTGGPPVNMVLPPTSHHPNFVPSHTSIPQSQSRSQM